MKVICQLLIAFLLVLNNFVFAQKQDSTKFNTSSTTATIPIDSLKTILDREAIVFDGNGYYYKSSKKLKRGFNNRFLKKELKKSTDANTQYQIYNLKKNRGIAIFCGSYIGAYVVAIATTNPLGFLLLIPSVYGLIEATQSVKYFNKAIANYNRDAVIDAAKKVARQ